jgi:hypothetical protein
VSEGAELTVANLGDSIREKVRKTLFDAIPEAQMEALVKKEFDAFFKERPQTTYSGNIDTSKPAFPSIFSTLVQEEMQKQFKANIVEAVKKKLGEPQWNYTEQAYRFTNEIVDAMAPVALTSVMKGITGQVINEMRNSMNKF